MAVCHSDLFVCPFGDGGNALNHSATTQEHRLVCSLQMDYVSLGLFVCLSDNGGKTYLYTVSNTLSSSVPWSHSVMASPQDCIAWFA